MEVEFELALEDGLDLLGRYLLRTYFVPSAALGTGRSKLSQIDIVSALFDLIV